MLLEVEVNHVCVDRDAAAGCAERVAGDDQAARAARAARAACSCSGAVTPGALRV